MTEARRPDPQRVGDLFDAVVDLDPDDAKAHLDAECAGDAALREAVERLVASDRAWAPGFLEPSATLVAEVLREQRAGEPALPASPEAVHEADMPAGSARLGRFYVLHKLGEGGMGAVYVGYDADLDRRVALKLLHRGVATHAWLRREGQALGRLTHPNVVTVHEVGEQHGRVFLAMELVEGPTLRGWLEERPRSFPELIRVFHEAGRGLAAAHEAGLVHRDFKPDNVLIGRDGRARVVDFGIAALADAAPERSTDDPLPPTSALASPLTQKGAILGTPAFMSPEQLRGERATPRSDQWSFCVSLYRAVHGSLPFPETDLKELAASVLHGAPAPQPRRAEVPSWLAPILLRGLAKEPEARFASMTDLIDAVEAHLPRDPELDPLIVVRERVILSAVLAVLYVGLSIAMLGDAGARALTTPTTLVAVPAIMLAVVLAVIALRWRYLSRNFYGRRLSGLFLCGPLFLLVHRIIASLLGETTPQTLVGDLVVTSAFYAAAAHTEDHWIAAPAAITAAAAMAGALAPSRASVVFGAAVLLSTAAMGVRVFLDRHMSPT